MTKGDIQCTLLAPALLRVLAHSRASLRLPPPFLTRLCVASVSASAVTLCLFSLAFLAATGSVCHWRAGHSGALLIVPSRARALSAGCPPAVHLCCHDAQCSPGIQAARRTGAQCGQTVHGTE